MLVSDWFGYGVTAMRKNKTLYRIAFERVCFVADSSYRSKAFGFLLSMISPVAREGKATE